MADFLPRLRLNNLYPALLPMGGRERNYPIFDEFMERIAGQQPMMQQPMNRVPQIAQQAAPNLLPKQMDVVYQPSLMDKARTTSAARNAFGDDILDPQGKYRDAQLGLKGRELDIKEGIATTNAELGRRKADVAAFRATNPGVKIVAPKGGNIVAINSATGNVIKDFGPSGSLSDAERLELEQSNAVGRIDATGRNAQALEGTRQTGRVSLAEMQGRQAVELEGVKAGNKPVGSNRIETVRDAQGNIVGARTTKTTDVMPSGQPKTGASALMFGPNGEGPFSIPIDKTDEAQEKYQMRFKK